MPLHHEPITRPDSDSDQVRELHRILILGLPELARPDAQERIKIPQFLYEILKSIVRDVQLGRSIVLLREDASFTTQCAANFLGMSRLHLVKLLEKGDIPFHLVGIHRRIRCGDFVTYAKQRNAERREILDNLGKEAFAAGLYDVLLPRAPRMNESRVWSSTRYLCSPSDAVGGYAPPNGGPEGVDAKDRHIVVRGGAAPRPGEYLSSKRNAGCRPVAVLRSDPRTLPRQDGHPHTSCTKQHGLVTPPPGPNQPGTVS